MNVNFRIRSGLGLADAAVISGSEDGQIYAWNLLDGSVIQRLDAHAGKVASAVACNGARKEWVSAGVDCKFTFFVFIFFPLENRFRTIHRQLMFRLGTAAVWGMPS